MTIDKKLFITPDENKRIHDILKSKLNVFSPFKVIDNMTLYGSTIESVIEDINFEDIKDVHLFRAELNELLLGDIKELLSDDVIASIRDHFCRVEARDKLQKLIDDHSYTYEEKLAEKRKKAAEKAANTRKANAVKSEAVKKAEARATKRKVKFVKKSESSDESANESN